MWTLKILTKMQEILIETIKRGSHCSNFADWLLEISEYRLFLQQKRHRQILPPISVILLGEYCQYMLVCKLFH